MMPKRHPLRHPHRSEERRVGKECRSQCDWSSDVCSSDLCALKPSKRLSVIKLTTPPTASEPYDAEAPPVTTSTRLISNCGNWLMSGTPVTFAPTTRWLSSSVNVRMVPRPRSANELKPCVPLDVLFVPVVTPVEPMSDGSLVIALKIFGCALFWRSSALIIVVGVGALKPV